MASPLLDRVIGVTGLTINSGTNPNVSQVNDFLVAGARSIANKILRYDPNKANLFSVTETLTSSEGLTTGTNMIVSVIRDINLNNSKKCIKVDPSLRSQINDSSSLYFKSKYNPAWHLLNNTVYVHPTPSAPNNSAYVTYVKHVQAVESDTDQRLGVSKTEFGGVTCTVATPSVFTKVGHTFAVGNPVSLYGFTEATELNGATGIIDSIGTPGVNNFTIDGIYVDGVAETTGGYVAFVGNGYPVEYEHLAVLYAGIRSLEYSLSKKTIDVLDLPPAPENDTALVFSSETVPTFQEVGSLSLPSSLLEANIDFSELPAHPLFVSPQLTFEASPTMLFESFEYPIPPDSTDVNAAIYTEKNVVFTELIPTYVTPIMETVVNPSIIWTSHEAPIAPELEDNLIAFSSTAPTFNEPILAIDPVPVMADLTIKAVCPSSPSLADSTVTFTHSAPTYTPPTLTYTAFPSGDIVWTNPTMPIAPILDMSIVTQVLSEVAMPSDVALPFVDFDPAPVTDWTFPQEPMPPLLDWSGVTQVIDSIEMPADVVLPTTIAITEPPTVSYSFPAPPIMQDLDWGDLEHWITAEEDAEMAATRINAAQVQASTYANQTQGYTQQIQAELQKNSGVVENWATEQTARVNVFQSQMSAMTSKYRDEGQGKQSIVAAQVQTLNAQVQQVVQRNQAEVSNFQAQSASYQTNIQGIIQKNTALLNAWSSEMTTKLQKYTSQISAEVNLMQGNTAKKQSEYEQKLRIRQAQMQEVQIQSTADVAIFQGDMAAYSTEYKSNLEKNQTQISSWSQENQLYLSKYQQESQNALNEFNKESLAYTTELQVSLKNADLASQDENQLIQKYSAEYQAYVGKTNAEVSEYTQNFQKTLELWSRDTGNKISAYQALVGGATNQFNADNVVYQADLQVALQQANVSNTDDAQKVQKFQSEIQKWNTSVTTQVTLNGAIIKEYLDKSNLALQKFGLLSQDSLAVFNSSKVDYDAKLAIAMKNVDVHLSQDRVKREHYQAKLQKYSTEVQQYVSKVQNQTGNNTTKIAEWKEHNIKVLEEFKSKIQAETQRTTIEAQEYSLELKKALDTYQAETGYDLSKQKMDVERAVVDFTNALQKSNVSFTSALAKFNAGVEREFRQNQAKTADRQVTIAKYQASVAALVQEFGTTIQKTNIEYGWMDSRLKMLYHEYNSELAFLNPASKGNPQQTQNTRRRR